MDWSILWFILGGVVVVSLIEVGRSAARTHTARRALASARQGRLVGPPARLVPANRQSWWGRNVSAYSGRVYRDGPDLVVLTLGSQARVALGDLRRAGVRVVAEDDTDTVRDVFGVVDETGEPYELQVPDSLTPAIIAVSQTPDQAPNRYDHLVAAVPWRMVGVALLFAFPFALHQIAWHTGSEVLATVQEVDDEFGYCTVTWGDGNDSHVATLDCYEPYPAEGAEIAIRALAGPLRGQAMDLEGSYEFGAIGLGGPAAALLLGSGLVASARLRHAPVRLRVPEAAGVPRGGADDPVQDLESMTLRDLAVAVAQREGWERGPFGAGFTLSPWARLVSAASIWPLSVTAAALFLGWLWPEEVPQPYTWPLTGLAVLAGLYAAVATGRTLRRIQAPSRATPGALVELVTVRGVDDRWLVLLFNLRAASPSWLVVFPAAARPPLSATAQVLGTLEDGSAVRLAIDGHQWEPAGPVHELDDEARTEILADLRASLAIPTGEAWWEDPDPRR